MVIISALAAATENLGLAVTLGFAQSPPFQFARQMATLDHATRGRIAWNIVTGANPNGWRNLGYDGMPAHDTRYAIADEYLEVLYKLWEGSWDEDALLADRDSGLHADPSKIHPIDHVGEHFKVRGPVPGDALAAAHAAALPGGLLAGRPRLLRPPRRGPVHPEPLDRGRPQADRRDPRPAREARPHARRNQVLPGPLLRRRLDRGGGACAKERELEEKIDVDGMVAHMGGAIGVDLGGLDPDDTPRRGLHRRRPGHPQLAARERRRRQPDGARRDAPDEPPHPRRRHPRADRRPPRRLPRGRGGRGQRDQRDDPRLLPGVHRRR